MGNIASKKLYDIMIIGSGVTGLAAGMYAGRFNLKTIVIGNLRGGVITTTNIVENYPGFKRLSGMELAKEIEDHAREYKIDIIDAKVKKIEKCKTKSFLVYADNKIYEGKTILFATGTIYRGLNVPGEAEFANRGVHYCVSCDGPFYKGKKCIVVGGGDSAVKEALLLSEYASKVYIVYRGEKVRPEPINYERMIRNKKIEVINNTNIVEIKGDKFVKSVIFDKPYKGNKEFKIDGVFIEIGHIPLSDLAKSLSVKLNEKGEIIIDKESKTNVPGIFAAGDVTNSTWKQAITGVAEGCIAAYHAYVYVSQNTIKPCGD
ncbi:FAD-dependent oxidoreductase [Candidatus Woesearchaeota archaeon]|nr:FAD-dependent oxidoreductase [Candidatus Woesearchaeota archaeon]